jgi:hypothetical protein
MSAAARAGLERRACDVRSAVAIPRFRGTALRHRAHLRPGSQPRGVEPALAM